MDLCVLENSLFTELDRHAALAGAPFLSSPFFSLDVLRFLC